MSIIRIKRRRSYTVLSNSLINDARLSWDSLGVLVYLMSKPDDWEISPRQMLNSKDFQGTRRQLSEHKLYRKVFAELREAGYLDMTRFGNGKVLWEVYEEPRGQSQNADGAHCAEHSDEKPSDENPRDDDRQDLIKTDLLVSTDPLPKEEEPQAAARKKNAVRPKRAASARRRSRSM